MLRRLQHVPSEGERVPSSLWRFCLVKNVQTSDPEAVKFEKHTCRISEPVHTVVLVHKRELPALISCWPLKTDGSSALLRRSCVRERAGACVSLHQEKQLPAPPLSHISAAVLQELMLNANYMALLCPFVLLKCFCLRFVLLTKESSDTHLYLLTVTSPTRAASPPSTTKTCKTTRISGTCESSVAFIHEENPSEGL